jgi:glucose-6-phosphate 1-dehydrogenase
MSSSHPHEEELKNNTLVVVLGASGDLAKKKVSDEVIK